MSRSMIGVIAALLLFAGRAEAQEARSGTIQQLDEWLANHRETARTSETVSGMQDTFNDEDKGNLGAARRQIDRNAAGTAAVNSGINAANYGVNTMRSFFEFVDAFKELNQQDRLFDPSARPDGTPELPVSCSSGACMACYEEAHGKLRRTLFTLGRLQSIYNRTKTFVDKAVAFGDSASGIHAVTGLAWQKEKSSIQGTMTDMNKAFDNKKPELMAPFKTALEMIAECERQHFNNPDWYARYGFIYYSFIDQKYSRAP